MSIKSKLAALLGRWTPLEWGFVLGLAVPLAATTIVLRTIRVIERGVPQQALTWIDVYKSDVFFLFAFAIAGLAILGIVRGSGWRWPGFALIQVCAVVVVSIEIVAFRFFMVTGSTLDFQLIYFSLSQPKMTFDVVASEVPTYIWVMLGVFAAICLLIPWLLAGMWHRWIRPRLGTLATLRPRRSVSVQRFMIVLFACTIGMSRPIVDENTAFVRNATLTVGLSGWWELKEQFSSDSTAVIDTTNATLRPRKNATPRNVVIILLESTRARAVSHYNSELETTPHLDALAQKSLVAEHALAVVPHTSKALVAVLCGIEPRMHVPITEAMPDGIPGKCLASLLAEQGYQTGFFQSATQRFEDRAGLVKNLGYETFVPSEKMSKRGWDKANYFGTEDDIMLEPSSKWLDEVRGSPFLLTFLTLTPHHNYLAPKRYGRFQWADDKEYNRYLNTIRYVDEFTNSVIEMFKEKGLYEDTIFVILGDHGEGFSEHGRRQHDNVIWQEGLHIPLLIHDVTRFQQGKRIEYGVNQLDLIPTITDLLGYDIADATFPGQNMLEVDRERTLRAHCWYERRCMAAVRGTQKMIYHFDQRPDEFFDLAQDPMETTNIIERTPDAERWRSELVNWRARVNSMYRSHSRTVLERYVTREPPVVEHPLEGVRFGDFVGLVGVDYPRDEVKPGSSVAVTFVFEVLKKPPVEWKLFLHGQAKGQKIKNLDHVPVEGLYPLEDWTPGDFVTDMVRFNVPPNAKDEYVLWLGFYHPEDGRAEITGMQTDGKRRARAAVLKLVPRKPGKPPGSRKPTKLKTNPRPLKPKP